MKIALIDPSLYTWPYDIALARGLMDQGHEVTIYGCAPWSPLPADETRYLDDHFYKNLEARWVRRLPTKLFLALKGISHAASMVRLVAALKAAKPDVIHFQWAPLAILDKRFLPALRKIAPIIFTVHDSEPFNDNPKSRLQRLGAIEIMRDFDRLIVHTQKAQGRVESYGIRPDHIARIAHGLLDTLPPTRSAPVSQAAPDPRLVLLLFGHIKPYKGTDILLQAFSRLPEAMRQACRLRIVGRPQIPMEPILALIDSLGLADQVELDARFIDQDEVGDLLRSADIQLFPYTEIDASGVLMIALAVGKPIIASDIGLFRELLEDGVHALLLPPSDIAELSAALEKLIGNAALRDAMGENVARLCAAIPGWKEIGAQTTRLYEEAIAERSLV